MSAREHLPKILVLAITFPLIAVLAAYWFQFSDGWFHPLSKDPTDWSYFGSYVGGLLAPIYAAIAVVGAFLMIVETRGQNRFDRAVTMLRQTLQARPSDLDTNEPTQNEARDNLIRAISDNVVEGQGWENVLDAFAARQYDFLDLPFDKIVKSLKEALSIISQEENYRRQQHLLDWLYLELRDHEYYLLVAHVISDPKSRVSDVSRKIGLFKEYRFKSADITARLSDLGFEPAKD